MSHDAEDSLLTGARMTMPLMHKDTKISITQLITALVVEDLLTLSLWFLSRASVDVQGRSTKTIN